MQFLTTDDVSLRKKTILLRVDLNSAIINNKIELSERLIEHSKTIKELIKKKAKVVILAHQGRKGEKDFTSLKQHAKLLNKFVKVKFINDIIGKKAIREIEKLKYGEALLLENVRFLKEEYNNDRNNKFITTLAKYFDYYVNDAFSVSHRDETSVTGFPKVMKGLIGRVMEREIKGADKLKIKNPLFLLGGNKISEHQLLLKNRKNVKVLASGLFGQACLVAKGYNLGKQNKVLKEFNAVIDKYFVKKYRIMMPVDFAVNFKGKRKEFKLSEFPNNYEIFDIGKETIKRFIKEIRKAKVILMKGPCGRYEDSKFRLGTRSILNALIKSKAYTIIAGGNTLSAIKNLKIDKNKFDHISLSGGAFLDYIAGEKLPGLEVLKR